MENIVIEGIISTTSNKQSKDFKVKKKKKTAYLELDEVNEKKLEAFGVSKYTSKDGDDFFCLKVVEKLKLYFDDKTNVSVEHYAGINAPNFKTTGKVKMNVIKGEKTGNVFYRLQALMITTENELVEIEAENPFA